MPPPHDVAAQTFADVFLRCRGRLARAVGRIVQPRDVDDVVQETFLKCFQASIRGPIRHPRAFMLTTAKNLALNHAAKAESRLVSVVASFDDRAVPLYCEAYDSSDADRREQLARLAVALGALPRQCRHAFVLKKVHGLSRKEIAARMGIAESTVQKHVAKGFVLCADTLARGERAPRQNENCAPTTSRRPITS